MAEPAESRADTIEQLRRRMAEIPARSVGPSRLSLAALSHDQHTSDPLQQPPAPTASILRALAVPAPLAELLPHRGLARGSTVHISGATALHAGLIASVTGAGGWAALIGTPPTRAARCRRDGCGPAAVRPRAGARAGRSRRRGRRRRRDRPGPTLPRRCRRTSQPREIRRCPSPPQRRCPDRHRWPMADGRWPVAVRRRSDRRACSAIAASTPAAAASPVSTSPSRSTPEVNARAAPPSLSAAIPEKFNGPPVTPGRSRSGPPTERARPRRLDRAVSRSADPADTADSRRRPRRHLPGASRIGRLHPRRQPPPPRTRRGSLAV